MNNKLAEIRKEKNITQSELARKAGVSRSYINKIEHGKLNGSIKLSIRIASILETPVEEIFFEDVVS